MDEVKDGKLVGEDKYGNKYYENPYYFYGRNRWVEYAPHFHLEYDGSQIPAEWFGWMHYKVSVEVMNNSGTYDLIDLPFRPTFPRTWTAPVPSTSGW